MASEQFVVVDDKPTLSFANLQSRVNELCDKSNQVKSNICSVLGKTCYSDVALSEMYGSGNQKFKKKDLVDTIDSFITLSDGLSIYCVNSDVIRSDDLFKHVSISKSDVDITPINNTLSDLQNKLIEELNKLENLSTKNQELYNKMTEQINTISQNVDGVVNDLNSNRNNTNSDSLHSVDNTSFSFNDKNVKKRVSDIPYFDDNIPDFIDDDEVKKFSKYLEGCTFVDEGGHRTIKFGETYNYNGSRNNSIEMPPIVSDLMDRLNEQYVGEGKPKLNSCLINRYEGPNSYIKEHSDNERSIERNSSIFTVSIGQLRTLKFRNLVSGDTTALRLESGSMYSMSRLSQEYNKHRIDEEEDAEDIRYSLTFRSVCWMNHNRTIILGDSNTKGVKFGEEKFGEVNFEKEHWQGTLGPSIPGKRIDAFIIDQIDPIECIAYNNIVVHCGINNIKSRHIDADRDLRDLYTQFKSKIEDIRQVNRKSRILISPILPTRLPGLNRKALFFNKLIFDDLLTSNLHVEIINGYGDMLGEDECLNIQLARYHDYLHLNASGVRHMAKCIKDIILIKKRRGDKQNSSKPSRSVTRGGDKRPP